jgi:hypothetical protein
VKIFVSFLLLTAYCLLLTALSSCGRRADPVLVEPSDAREDEAHSEPVTRETGTESQEARGDAETGAVMPEPPTGLTALFTGMSVVMTWDEIIGKGVRFYRIYRSDGNAFDVIGEAVTPVFTDRNVKPDVTYIYKVSAVGQSEGMLSEAVEIVTTGE